MELHWVELNLSQVEFLLFLTLNQVRWEGGSICPSGHCVRPTLSWCTPSVNETHLSRCWNSSLISLPLPPPLPPLQYITKSCLLVSHAHLGSRHSSHFPPFLPPQPLSRPPPSLILITHTAYWIVSLYLRMPHPLTQSLLQSLNDFF